MDTLTILITRDDGKESQLELSAENDDALEELLDGVGAELVRHNEHLKFDFIVEGEDDKL